MNESKFLQEARTGDTAHIPAEYLIELIRIKQEYEKIKGKKELPIVCELLSRSNDTGLGHYLTPAEFLHQGSINKDVIVQSSELKELLEDHRRLHGELTNSKEENTTLKQELRALRSEVKFKDSMLKMYQTDEKNTEYTVKHKVAQALETKAASETHVLGISKYLNNLTTVFKGDNYDTTH